MPRRRRPRRHRRQVASNGVWRPPELVDLGVKAGLIEKSGAWFSYKETKLQGFEKLYLFFENAPEIYEEMRSEIKKMLGL